MAGRGQDQHRGVATPLRRSDARALQHRLRSYLRPTLLAIDEVGYLAYDAHAADLLFQVVSRRYEQKSIVITTNELTV